MDRRVFHPKFHKPYLKLNLNHINFPIHLSCNLRNSFNNLPLDPYINDNTRYRRYANYSVKISNNFPNYRVNHNIKNTFKQNVKDDRKEERIFESLENPQDPFIFEYIRYISKLLNISKTFEELSIDVHQVRQVTYPGIDSHNSPEGIHQDGCDYVVPSLILKRFNIRGGLSSIYDKDKKVIDKFLLGKYDFTLLNDKELYHYVTPIIYYESDGFDQYGFRDLIGLDIHIIK